MYESLEGRKQSSPKYPVNSGQYILTKAKPKSSQGSQTNQMKVNQLIMSKANAKEEKNPVSSNFSSSNYDKGKKIVIHTQEDKFEKDNERIKSID